jgi:PKD repeat protein
MLLAFFKTDPTATPWFLRATPSGAAPGVTATADHASGSSGLTVHFNASATALRGNSISQYVWTYDDGDFAYGQAPVKTFYAPGTYLVHLAVTDSRGNVALSTLTITITGGHTSGGQTLAVTPTSGGSSVPDWVNLPNPSNGFHPAALGNPPSSVTHRHAVVVQHRTPLPTGLPEPPRRPVEPVPHLGRQFAPSGDWMNALSSGLEVALR